MSCNWRSLRAAFRDAGYCIAHLRAGSQLCAPVRCCRNLSRGDGAPCTHVWFQLADEKRAKRPLPDKWQTAQELCAVDKLAWSVAENGFLQTAQSKTMYRAILADVQKAWNDMPEADKAGFEERSQGVPQHDVRRLPLHIHKIVQMLLICSAYLDHFVDVAAVRVAHTCATCACQSHNVSAALHSDSQDVHCNQPKRSEVQRSGTSTTRRWRPGMRSALMTLWLSTRRALRTGSRAARRAWRSRASESRRSLTSCARRRPGAVSLCSEKVCWSDHRCCKSAPCSMGACCKESRKLARAFGHQGDLLAANIAVLRASYLICAGSDANKALCHAACRCMHHWHHRTFAARCNGIVRAERRNGTSRSCRRAWRRSKQKCGPRCSAKRSASRGALRQRPLQSMRASLRALLEARRCSPARLSGACMSACSASLSIYEAAQLPRRCTWQAAAPPFGITKHSCDLLPSNHITSSSVKQRDCVDAAAEAGSDAEEPSGSDADADGTQNGSERQADKCAAAADSAGSEEDHDVPACIAPAPKVRTRSRCAE